MRPPNNYLLVAIPERFTTTAVPGKAQLVLPAGSDDWQTLTAQLKAGDAVNIETADDIQKLPVRQGTVVAVPNRLTDDMTLCTAPGTRYIDRQVVVTDERKQPIKDTQGRAILKNEGYTEVPRTKTCADITEYVRVGELIHFDPSCLTDEVAAGLYLVPYWAVICVLIACGRLNQETGFYDSWQYVQPVGGYVLLTPMWADDVEETEIQGITTKVRYYNLTYANGERVIAELNVSPLPNEGVVAWVGSPLRGTVDKLSVGELVVFPTPVKLESIAGTDYLCVRQDEIMAVRTPA